LATQDVTRTPGEHGRPRCNGCLRPTRLGAGLKAQPAVLYPFRRRTPQGCSRDSGGLLGLVGLSASHFYPPARPDSWAYRETPRPWPQAQRIRPGGPGPRSCRAPPRDVA
jgi:hypothetical protein